MFKLELWDFRVSGLGDQRMIFAWDVLPNPLGEAQTDFLVEDSLDERLSRMKVREIYILDPDMKLARTQVTVFTWYDVPFHPLPAEIKVA